MITCNLDEVVDTHLFAGVPFSFSGNPDIYDRMLQELSYGLKVGKQDICIVGSARIGFSLSPEKFGVPFGQFSDVDVVVVSPDLFDPSWINILTNPLVRWSSLRDHLKIICVGRELPFDRLRANVFQLSICVEKTRGSEY